jgi:peptidoglycan/xylan/chitin deacetylase (PgdA/CDA1 family)
VTTPKFLILCYHRIGTGGIPLYSELSPKLFEAQIHFLRKHYRIISLAEVRRGLEEPARTGPAVAITFDDGYRGVYTHAFPILQKYNIPATVFLIADSVESGQVAWYDRVFLALQVMPAGHFEIQLDHARIFRLSSRRSRLYAALEIMSYLRSLPDPRRQACCADLEKRVKLPQLELEDRMMDWEHVRTMQSAGVVFGSHTVTHPVVSRLTPEELDFEIAESKKRLEAKLGIVVEDFAFPFGHSADCGTQAAGWLARCGYRSAVTTVPGVNTPGVDHFALRRVQIGEEHTLSMFSLCLTHFFLHSGPLPSSTAVNQGRNEVTEVSASSIEGTRHA